MDDDGSLTPIEKYRKAAREFAVEVIGIETECRSSMSSPYLGVQSWPPDKQGWRKREMSIIKGLAGQADMTEKDHFDFLRRMYDELRVRFEG